MSNLQANASLLNESITLADVAGKVLSISNGLSAELCFPTPFGMVCASALSPEDTKVQNLAKDDMLTAGASSMKLIDVFMDASKEYQALAKSLAANVTSRYKAIRNYLVKPAGAFVSDEASFIKITIEF
jgi:hypothetical protein